MDTYLHTYLHQCAFCSPTCDHDFTDDDDVAGEHIIDLSLLDFAYRRLNTPGCVCVCVCQVISRTVVCTPAVPGGSVDVTS